MVIFMVVPLIFFSIFIGYLYYNEKIIIKRNIEMSIFMRNLCSNYKRLNNLTIKHATLFVVCCFPLNTIGSFLNFVKLMNKYIFLFL